jgi:predicted NBD/HSP70 family sugar kinase
MTLSQSGQRAIQPPVMKKMNQISLLTLIREHGPISRAVLARLSKLSKPTVSAQVETLLQRGLVLETGQGRSSERGGKKPTHLEFNADCGSIVVCEIDPLEIRIVLTDLKGAATDRAHLATEARLGAQHVVARLEQRIRALLSRAARADKLCLIGIAAPGRVDVRRGVVLDAGNVFNWENVSIADPLTKAFKAPVLVDNLVNLAALAEMTYGAAKGVRDFILIRHDTGIGCGVVLGGKLHHGSNWAAGEIAHFILDLNQAGKDWTPRGYLELQVGADRLAERVRAASRSGEKVAKLLDGGGELQGLFQARKQGNPTARKIVTDLVLHLGIAIAHIAATYDPSLVVLQGEIFPPLLEEIEQVARRAVPWLPRVAVSELGQDAALRGAIVAARTQAHEQIAKALSEGATQHLGREEWLGLGRDELVHSDPAVGL